MVSTLPHEMRTKITHFPLPLVLINRRQFGLLPRLRFRLLILHVFFFSAFIDGLRRWSIWAFAFRMSPTCRCILKLVEFQLRRGFPEFLYGGQSYSQ